MDFRRPGAGVFGGRFPRRDFIGVSALVAAGLRWPGDAKLQAGAAPPTPSARAVILLHMGGGASHIDTFDPKPEAPAEYRGSFAPIASNVPGVMICEHLPRTAAQMDKVAVLRSVHHTQPEHQQAAHYMLTGWMPSAVVFRNEHPAFGAVVAKERPGPLPAPYVVVQGPELLVNRHHDAAFLGSAFDPLTIKVAFDAGDLPAPPGTTLPEQVTVARTRQRRSLLEELTGVRMQSGPHGNGGNTHGFQRAALDMAVSPRGSVAFDLFRENDRTRDRYGRNILGQGCLLARRLVEAGVRFVTVSRGGWDTHQKNFESLAADRLPELDLALSALLEDLAERGLLQSTLVVWSGEFGRTPRINKDAGRDHWAGVMSMCLAGGGITGGQVWGASDGRGEAPAEDPVTPENVWATMYHLLGIDCSRLYQVPASFEFRSVLSPAPILSDRQPIRGLL